MFYLNICLFIYIYIYFVHYDMYFSLLPTRIVGQLFVLHFYSLIVIVLKTITMQKCL